MYKRYLFVILSYIIFYTGIGDINSSSTSPSSTNSPSVSISMMNTASTFTPSATSSCVLKTYNISNDFSGTQGQNGWYYGYNNAGVFSQFTTYDTSGTTHSPAWFYDINAWAQIGHNIIIPNMGGSGGAGYCSDYGDKSPVLQWIPPANICNQDVTISLYLSPKAAIGAALTVNGNVLYLSSNLAITYTNSFNVYNITSLQLEINPYNNGCNDPQTKYSLVITPIGPSISAKPSITSSESHINTVSSLPSHSSSPTFLNLTYPTQSASATTSCAFRSYNSALDFSGAQGAN
jgi:hypothetical protein